MTIHKWIVKLYDSVTFVVIRLHFNDFKSKHVPYEEIYKFVSLHEVHNKILMDTLKSLMMNHF